MSVLKNGLLNYRRGNRTGLLKNFDTEKSLCEHLEGLVPRRLPKQVANH